MKIEDVLRDEHQHGSRPPWGEEVAEVREELHDADEQRHVLDVGAHVGAAVAVLALDLAAVAVFADDDAAADDSPAACLAPTSWL